mgnify:CR=1 FL=1
MIDFLEFIAWILGFIVAIVNAIFFVKVWRMTNDVRKLTKRFVPDDVEKKRERHDGTRENTYTPFVNAEVLVGSLNEIGFVEKKVDDKIRVKLLDGSHVEVYPSDLILRKE